MHGISAIVCLGLLLHTVTISKICRRNCIDKFNAYCEFDVESPRPDTVADSVTAPVLEVISQDYQDVRFNYSLWYPSPYKGPPTPEVDQAWHRIMQCKFAISNSEFLMLMPKLSDGQIIVTADDILRIGYND
jgi:hypothetical protein